MNEIDPVGAEKLYKPPRKFDRKSRDFYAIFEDFLRNFIEVLRNSNEF